MHRWYLKLLNLVVVKWRARRNLNPRPLAFISSNLGLEGSPNHQALYLLNQISFQAELRAHSSNRRT